MGHGKSNASNWRLVAAIALCGSALLQGWLVGHLGARVTGCDGLKYVSNAASFASIQAVLDPRAFDGNYWPPGYSGLIYLLGVFGGHQVVAVRCAQVAMSLSLAVMAYFMTMHISRAVALTTLIATALSPTIIWGSMNIGYETFLGWLLTLSLTLLWSARRTRRRWLVTGVAGFSFSLALLVQFKVVAALPVLFIMARTFGRQGFAGLAAGLVGPTGLWAARNWASMATPIPWTTNGPVNLWIGNNPQATGQFMPPPPIPSGWGGTYQEAALHFIRSDPSRFLTMTALKFARQFVPTGLADHISDTSALIHTPVAVAEYAEAAVVALLFLSFLFGLLWRLKVRALSLAPVGVVALLLVAVNLPFIAEPRYRVPLQALLLALSVSTASELFEKWRPPRG